jgi:hypothetical protein
MARKFIELLTGDPASPMTFQTFDDSPQGRGGLARVFHGSIDEHFEALLALSHRGAGVFVMVNRGDGVVQQGRKTCRTNGNVVEVRAHFIDLDGAPLEPALGVDVEPLMVIESSPNRWHVYWKFDGMDLARFSAVQSTLAACFQADPSVKDLARVMRLPGFVHQKGEPFLTHIVFPEEFNATEAADAPA